MCSRLEVCRGTAVELSAGAAVSSEGWAGEHTSRFSYVALGRPQTICL